MAPAIVVVRAAVTPARTEVLPATSASVATVSPVRAIVPVGLAFNPETPAGEAAVREAISLLEAFGHAAESELDWSPGRF